MSDCLRGNDQVYELTSLTIDTRDHPFKTSANFHDFWPLPPTIGIPAKCLWRRFLILMYCDLSTIETWGHPSPLRHAEVLDGPKTAVGWMNSQENCRAKSLWHIAYLKILIIGSKTKNFVDSWNYLTKRLDLLPEESVGVNLKHSE